MMRGIKHTCAMYDIHTLDSHAHGDVDVNQARDVSYKYGWLLPAQADVFPQCAMHMLPARDPLHSKTV